MKVLSAITLFFSSVSFAGTLNCMLKESPRNSRLVVEQSSANYTNVERGYVTIVAAADSQIKFDALGDDSGIWVSVTDARTGISAQNQARASGTSAQLNIPKIGEYSIYCTTSQAQ